MRLCFDLGNSRIKFGCFENNELIDNGTLSYTCSLQPELKRWKSKVQEIVVSSVKGEDYTTEFTLLLESICDNVVVISHAKDIPLKLIYDTPETLGLDRLVACWGARQLQNQGALLVIDAGTCVTYDYLSKDDEFLGGAISPGLQMRFKSVHNFTDRLPLVEADDKKPFLIGNSTEKSIRSGIINGLKFEMEGFIEEHKKKNTSIKVFLTGGDLIFFEDALKSNIFAENFLNLYGLNALGKEEIE